MYRLEVLLCKSLPQGQFLVGTNHARPGTLIGLNSKQIALSELHGIKLVVQVKLKALI